MNEVYFLQIKDPNVGKRWEIAGYIIGEYIKKKSLKKLAKRQLDEYVFEAYGEDGPKKAPKSRITMDFEEIIHEIKWAA